MNQNQHCISRTGQNGTGKLAVEIGKWDIKTDVNGKCREQTCIHRKYVVMQGIEDVSGKSKSNVMGKGDLVDWFKMAFND